MFALGKESPAGAFDFDSNPPLEHQKNRLNGGFFGAPAGIRTPDTLLKRQVLCLLSYWGGYISFSGIGRSESTWLGWRDSNPLYRSQSPVCYHYTTSHFIN